MLLPTGVRFGTYATEGRYIHTRPQALWFAAFLLALVILPQVASLYATGVLTVMFITLMAVYGLQVTALRRRRVGAGSSRALPQHVLPRCTITRDRKVKPRVGSRREHDCAWMFWA